MIYESNEGENRPLAWAQTRNMPLTHRVTAAHLYAYFKNHILGRMPKSIMPYVQTISGYIGELEDGKHHIIHLPGSSG